MQIAHIYPIKNMGRMYTQKYNMLLTHLALSSKEYFEHAKELCKKSYTILDNSLIENSGVAIDISTVCDVADSLRVSEIILPDVFQNGPATIKSVMESLDYLYNRYPNGIPFKLQAVAQGKDPDEFTECFKTLESFVDIDVIGIPKILAKSNPRGRLAFEELWQNTNKEIHLLGLYYSFSELLQYKNPSKIRSCDTCHLSFLITHDLSIFSVRPDGFTIDLENDYFPSSKYVKGKVALECLIR